MKRTRALGTCLLVGAVTFFGSGCSGDGASKRVGSTVEATDDSAFRHRTWFQVPTGKLTVGLAKPVSRLPLITDADRPSVDGGGSFVGVTWQTDLGGYPAVIGEEPYPTTTLALVVDGERYPLPRVRVADSLLGEPAYYVALPVEAEDLTLNEITIEATFVGRTQRVNVGSGDRAAGAFAPLYRRQGMVSPDCPTTLPTPGRVTGWFAECELSWYTTPYLPSRGWSERGTAWLLLYHTVNANNQWFWRPHRGTGGPAALYYLDDGTRRSSITVDGEPQLNPSRKKASPGYSVSYTTWSGLLFQVDLSGARLDIDHRFVSPRLSASGPSGSPRELRRSVHISMEVQP